MKLSRSRARIWICAFAITAVVTTAPKSVLADDYLNVRFDDVLRFDAGLTSTLPSTGVFICGPGKINSVAYRRICFSLQEVTSDPRSAHFINRCKDSALALIQLKATTPGSKAYLSFPMSLRQKFQDFRDGTAHIWSDQTFRCSLVVNEERLN